MATVSMVAARPGAAASARARFPALAMRSKGALPASTGVVRSVTSPQPTRIGVELSVIGSGGSMGKSNQDQGQQVGCEHGKQVHLRPGTRASELVPDENAPEGSDHGRRLSDRVGNGNANQAGGDKIEHRSHSPDHSSENSEKVIGAAGVEVGGRTERFADQGFPHQENIEEKTTNQRSE